MGGDHIISSQTNDVNDELDFVTLLLTGEI